MSHKKKHITWYSLWKRIGKMRIAFSQNHIVKVKVNNMYYDAELLYEDDGETPILSIEI